MTKLLNSIGLFAQWGDSSTRANLIELEHIKDLMDQKSARFALASIEVEFPRGDTTVKADHIVLIYGFSQENGTTYVHFADPMYLDANDALRKISIVEFESKYNHRATLINDSAPIPIN